MSSLGNLSNSGRFVVLEKAEEYNQGPFLPDEPMDFYWQTVRNSVQFAIICFFGVCFYPSCFFSNNFMKLTCNSLCFYLNFSPKHECFMVCYCGKIYKSYIKNNGYPIFNIFDKSLEDKIFFCNSTVLLLDVSLFNGVRILKIYKIMTYLKPQYYFKCFFRVELENLRIMRSCLF